MNNIFKHIKLSLFAAFVVFAGSCSRDKNEFDAQNGEMTVTFNVSGIEDSKSQSPEPIRIASTNKNLMQEISNENSDGIKVSTTFNNEVGFTVDAIAEQTSIGKGISTADNGLSLKERLNKSANSTRVAANMANGRTYRILIYKNNSTTVWKTFDGTVGTAIKFDVTKGDSFQWVAYSYNEDQPLPAIADLQNPTVEALTDKDLLYAQGTLIVPTGTPTGNIKMYPIAILFKHKMTKVTVKIDAVNLALYAQIRGIKVQFLDQNNFKKATFNIKDNTFSNIQTVPVSQILDATTPTNDTWEYSYYTVDPSVLSQFQIQVTDLPVTFKSVDPSIASLNLATFTNANFPVVRDIKFTFNYTNPAIGNELIAKVGLSYTLPSKRIFHVSNNTTYAYSFQEGPAWRMISDLRNFGNLDNSLVRMAPWDPTTPSKGVWKGGNFNTDDKTENWLLANSAAATLLAKIEPSDASKRPDIIIFAYDQVSLPTTVSDALLRFVNAGGVFIWMNEFHDPTIPLFLNKLFGTDQPLVADNPIKVHGFGDGGAMYRLLSKTDGIADGNRVLDGPFGDARGKLWGEDASVTHGVTGLPLNKVEIYSYGQAVNRLPNATNASYVTMFRHTEKNFFFLGDGGLISYDGAVSPTACPFDYNPTTARPIPKLFGNLYIPPASDPRPRYNERSDYAYNGIIAGNIMLWAGELAEFNGITPWRYRP
ncbi:fimbrillin family protein [Sphingobacterium bovistauri]|uniref:Uncharacterized protein n=1 Tax=Sphingobacterium bovistauri TaxID=2781959 RepID=A0ABS7Z2J5_9SPHI|nr:fimbrillin family protein [Sphingobacterium bovistauri]MCA5004403.1 hypothetical protein [Sphingobacterium bovistauri]